VPDRTVIGHLLAALVGEGEPALLVIDDAHRLTDRSSLDALAEFIAYLPAGIQVVVAGRDPPGLPLERWRVEDRVLDIGPDDLVMDEGEVGQLVRQVGVHLPAHAVDLLAQDTAGWPALVALMVAAVHRTGVQRPIASPANHPVAEYLRSELLEARPEAEAELLIRTSILERLTGPLCDVLLERAGSEATLAELGRSMLLLDDYGGWYRYHPMLREFLRGELDRREPGRAAELHGRAAVWLASSDDLDSAIDHAFLSGDLELAVSILGKAFSRYHWTGRRAKLRAWIGRFDDSVLLEHPHLAVMAAWEEISEGDVHAVERYADLAAHGTPRGRPPDGTASLDSARAMLRSALGLGGIDATLASATLAVALEPVGSSWRDLALWTLALARHAAGDPDGADATLAEATTEARAARHEGLAYCLLGHRASLAMDRGDWTTASQLMAEADAIGAAGGFEGYVSASLARVSSIRLLRHDGEPRDVRRALVRAAGIRPMLTAAVPIVSLLTLLELARLHLAVGDPAGARSVLAQAGDIIRRRPDLGVLPAEVAALRAVVASLPIALAGASTLTAAELRVLALLPYYLSFGELGARLGVKATTVKTHATSIYGKLGASSRSEAIDLAVEAGLLERFPPTVHVSAIGEDAGRHG
jgi:LuxR family maltose regulon positive regulatory protein